MRAAKAVKDLTSVCRVLAEQLREVLAPKVIEACDIAYVSDEVLPLLVLVADMLCEVQPRPKEPKGLVMIWAAEQLGLPEELVGQLRRGASKLPDDEVVPPSATSTTATNATRPSGGSVCTDEVPEVDALAARAQPGASGSLQAGSVGDMGFAAGRGSDMGRAATVPALGSSDDMTQCESTDVLAPRPPNLPNSGRPRPGPKVIVEAHSHGTPSIEVSAELRKKKMFKKGEVKRLDASAVQRKKSDAQEEAEAYHPNDVHDVCPCGNVFVEDAVFCRKCGAKRPGEEEQPEFGQEDILKVLHTCPTLLKLSKDDLARVATISKIFRWEQDDTIVNCGQLEEYMHIILEGSGLISVPQFCGQLAFGECTGEEALRIPGTRSRTQITAMDGGVTTLSVPRDDFESLGIMKGVFGKGKKKRVAARGSIEESMILGIQRTPSEPAQTRCPNTRLLLVPDYEMTTYDRGMIMQGVAQNKVLGEVVSLSIEQREMIVNVVHLVEAPANVEVVKRGDKGAAFFMVQEGYLRLELGDGQPQVTLRHGDTFGELALLYDEPRSATITCLVDCKLWVLPQASFREVAQLGAKRKLAELAKTLKAVPVLEQNIDGTLFDMLAGVVEEVTFFEGDSLCVEGQDKGTFFFIQSGECSGEQELKPGAWIGEQELLNNSEATQTVTIMSDIAHVLILEHDDFKMVVDASSNVRSQKDSTPAAMFRNHVRKVMSKIQGISLLSSKGKSGPALDRCDVIGALGEGTFGLVLLMRDRTNQEEYALKAISKKQMVAEGCEENVTNERRLMEVMTSDFIVRLHKSYEDPEFVYLLLDTVFGGELFDVYSENDFWGSVEHSRFYIANIILGLTHLHEKRVVWRDLKLENCLVDARGYVKLTDLGIAKLVIGKTYTVCGTVDYFAPETLRQLGTNRAADWWACGVLLFIMIAGRSPFDAPEVPQIYKNIVKGMSKVEFPRDILSETKEVIMSLCRKKPEDRIPMQKGGVNNLRNMTFFECINWDDVLARTAKAPWVPPAPDYEKISQKKLTRDVEIHWDNLQELSS